MNFEVARRVADAVLYEGLVLYPYRATSRKNRFRFQFGVVAPAAFVDAGGSESPSMTVELPVEGGDDVAVACKLRFLQLRRRAVERWDGDRFVETDALETGARLHLAWDEAVEREVDFGGRRPDETPLAFEWRPEWNIETVETSTGVAGRVVRRTESLRIEVTSSCHRAGPSLWKLRVRIDNRTPYRGDPADRDRALRSSLVGAHLLFSVEGGVFVSLLDPPDHARETAESCRNLGAFPVLVGQPGERRAALGSPIILYDWPRIAPESQGDFHDATEMDEMLTLRTMTMTDEEKREARATDPRAASIVERADEIAPDALNRLHGAVRSLRVGPRRVTRGNRVRIRLGKRRGDAQDMFVDGRVATVEEVREDAEGQDWVAVIVDEDPAAEMNRWYGRYLWFHSDELELMETH